MHVVNRFSQGRTAQFNFHRKKRLSVVLRLWSGCSKSLGSCASVQHQELMWWRGWVVFSRMLHSFWSIVFPGTNSKVSSFTPTMSPALRIRWWSFCELSMIKHQMQDAIKHKGPLSFWNNWYGVETLYMFHMGPWRDNTVSAYEGCCPANFLVQTSSSKGFAGTNLGR